MRGRGPACRRRWGWLWPRFGDLYCLLSKPRRRLLSHYRRLEPLFIRGLHVKSSGAGHRGHLLRLLLYTLILCLLMGTGSSEPRVPLDNWLLPHLLTSPPLTLLHFTFKVLHFFSPLNLFHLPPSSDSQHLLVYFAFFLPPSLFHILLGHPVKNVIPVCSHISRVSFFCTRSAYTTSCDLQISSFSFHPTLGNILPIFCFQQLQSKCFS